MPRGALLALLLARAAIAVAGIAGEATVGDVRVQALSPTLLRVEPKGPKGFEDRTTFMVVNRKFPGDPIDITVKSLDDYTTLFATEHYDIVLKNGSQVTFKVSSPSGALLYDSLADQSTVKGKLHWPAPSRDNTSQSYALMDYPRFYAPPWGTVPIPPGETVDPSLNATNGYDFGNNVEGDTYIFLLGSDLASWKASRLEFLNLAGPCPLLPSYAYGTWFTYKTQYNEFMAKEDITLWNELQLPIDIWGLDMNWRLTDNNMDRYYQYPNTGLFSNFTEWFTFLRSKRLRTYFNDHPFPVYDRRAGGMQTSPEESEFRWNGLKEWMDRGLTFWWFEHNWEFSIPPPNVDNGGYNDGVWLGLDNAAWGSHVYWKAVEYFDNNVTQDEAERVWRERPMTLTKFVAEPDWRAGMNPLGQAESPAQHRYPVWRTGDGVNLQGSVESMVDAGLYAFKPFVHSDCGGDYRGSAGDLMRWTAHCAFGSILRFHGADHRAWTYDSHTVDVVRSYLNHRYALLPSLIGVFGPRATNTGFPIVARGDLYWPTISGSDTNQQYIFIDDFLVAPIFDSSTNISSRSVWVPPGDWQDAWDGSIVTGPAVITATQPYERQPMWHKREGGLVICADSPALRVDDQDWSNLTLEAFPASIAKTTQRTLFERDSFDSTTITMSTDAQGHLRITTMSTDAQGRLRIEGLGPSREWNLRIHLLKGQEATLVQVDSSATDMMQVLHPSTDVTIQHTGRGIRPGPHAGPVVEIRIPPGAHSHIMEMSIKATESIEDGASEAPESVYV